LKLVKLDLEAVDFNLDEVLENLANRVSVKAQEKPKKKIAKRSQLPR
jgi:hypothetical protein